MGGSGKQELIKISPLLSNVSASSSCDSYGLPMDVDEVRIARLTLRLLLTRLRMSFPEKTLPCTSFNG